MKIITSRHKQQTTDIFLTVDRHINRGMLNIYKDMKHKYIVPNNVHTDTLLATKDRKKVNIYTLFVSNRRKNDKDGNNSDNGVPSLHFR